MASFSSVDLVAGPASIETRPCKKSLRDVAFFFDTIGLFLAYEIELPEDSIIVAFRSAKVAPTRKRFFRGAKGDYAVEK